MAKKDPASNTPANRAETEEQSRDRTVRSPQDRPDDPLFVPHIEALRLPEQPARRGAGDEYSRLLETICGATDDSQAVEQYDGTLGVTTGFVAAHQSAVAQVQWNANLGTIYTNPGTVSGVRWGSGTMISDDVFLTCGHLFDQTGGGWERPRQNGTTNIISPQEIAQNMHLNFNFQVDASGNPRPEQQFPIVALLEYRLGGVDMALCRIGGNPGATFGRTRVSANDAAVSDMICIIGHPAGQRKRIEAGPTTSISGNLIRYNDIDTLGGNSGSGILRASDGQLVGVHTNGGCTSSSPGDGGSNFGQRIGAVVDASPILQAMRLTSPRVPPRAHIGVVSRSKDKLDIFVTDRNGAIFTAAWEPAFTDWWHGWWQLNGGRAAPGAPLHAVSRSKDKLDAFVIGLDNRVYTAAWEPAFTDWWHGWWQLNGGVAAPGAHVTAVSRSKDKLDAFVVGTDGRVYTAAWEPGFTDWWHGWWPIGNIRVPQGAPVHVVSRSADKLDIFVTDVNGAIMTAAWEPAFTDGFHGWWALNGGRAAPGAAVTAVSRNTDKLDVFVVGLDGRVWSAAWEPSFPDWWHGWWPIGNVRAPQGAPVHAVSRSADKLDIFVTDVNGAIMTAAWEPAFTDGWHGWWALNGGRAAPGAPVTAVSRSADKLDVFVVGNDGRVWTAAWEPSFPDWWHGWWPIGV
jgi:V8-like Glu-specific endopeptidase